VERSNRNFVVRRSEKSVNVVIRGQKHLETSVKEQVPSLLEPNFRFADAVPIRLEAQPYEYLLLPVNKEVM